MKIFCSILLLFVFSVPVFSQNNSSTENKPSKQRINYFYINKIKPQPFEFFSAKLLKPRKNSLQNTAEFKTIPIPPATAANRKIEFLPLSKPEDTVVKLLNE